MAQPSQAPRKDAAWPQERTSAQPQHGTGAQPQHGNASQPQYGTAHHAQAGPAAPTAQGYPWAAQPPYGHPGVPTLVAPPPFYSNKGLATALYVLVPAAVVLSLAVILTQGRTIVVEGGRSELETAGTFGLLSEVVGFAAWVVGLVWVFRVAHNARMLGGSPRAGWALGSWFIPVAHVVLPFLPMLQAWRNSRAGPVAPFVVWWAAFGGYLLLGYVFIAMALAWGLSQVAAIGDGMRVLSLPDHLVALQWTLGALYAIAGAAFLLVIHRLSQAQGNATQAPAPPAAFAPVP